MNIYVGNLPRTTDEEAVREKFAEYGEVSEVKLIKDHYTNELRGFGFVQMSSDEEARNAIEGINGTEMGGRTLTVNEARPRNNNRKSNYRNSQNRW